MDLASPSPSRATPSATRPTGRRHPLKPPVPITVLWYHMTDRDIDVIQGTLNVLILRALSWGPANGYAVAQWVRTTTGDEIELEEGALYPALHRMEQRGWIQAEWRLSPNNRRAKYY